MDDIRELARLLHERNQIDTAISGIILRPATIGHIGEYIAAKVFDIRLRPSATHKASDGYFVTGQFAGKSVDVKFYGKQESLLDVSEGQRPDYFLVFTGPEAAAASSRGSTRPLLIEHVYLFHGEALRSFPEPPTLNICSPLNSAGYSLYSDTMPKPNNLL
jgi:hypothetical protein